MSSRSRKSLYEELPLAKRLDLVQAEAVHSAIESLHANEMALVSMATGTGKTTVGAKVIRQLHDRKVLWITQMEELIYQTHRDLQNFFSKGEVGLYKARSRDLDCRITVASLQTIGQKETLKSLDPNMFDLVVVDEAHHSRAATWEKPIRYFKAPRLGLTATPFRHDGLGLEELFGRPVYELPYSKAQDYLLISKEHYRVILTRSQLEGVKTKSGDYPPQALDKLVISKHRNESIVDSYKKIGRKMMRDLGLPYQTICFCISIDHATRMRDLFREAGITCEVLMGRPGYSYREKYAKVSLTTTERREIYDSFTSGKGPEVLCSVSILNEGKNIPTVSCVLFARPTLSRIIYAQQIGRGCRRIDRVKEDFVILDYIDQMNQEFPPMTLNRLIGIPIKGEDIIYDYYKGEDPIVENKLIDYLSLDFSAFMPTWTKESAGSALKKFYSKRGKIQYRDLITAETELPGRRTLENLWGSVQQCFETLDIPFDPSKWTKERATKKILDFYKAEGRIRYKDFTPRNTGLPSRSTVKYLWGSLDQCLEELGIHAGARKRRSNWTKHTAAEALKKFYVSRGRVTSTDLGNTRGLPSSRTVYKYWGTWNRCAKELGLKKK